jgi:PAS domain S-box-containing protein
MTSLGRIEDKVKGFAAGAVDYVTKPLQVEEVRVRVNLHLKLHALQQSLEEKNAKLQQEIAERERAELSLQKSFDQIAELNGCLHAQMTQLEAAQELLEQTEAWYRNILHSAPDGILVVDGQGIIAQVNARAEVLFGYTEAELVGSNVEMLLPPAVRNLHENRRAEFAAGEAAVRPMSGIVIGNGCRKDGSEFPVDVSLARLQGGEGGGVMFCTVVREVVAGRA